MVVRISDKKQNYNNVTKLLVKPKKKAFDVKMNDYITKPIDFQKMEVVLKHVLSKKDPLS